MPNKFTCAYDRLLSKIKKNVPTSDLYYTTTTITSALKQKKKRKELKYEITTSKYADYLNLNRKTREYFNSVLKQGSNDYFMDQLSKTCLNGLIIEVKLTGKVTEGIIIHEGRNTVYFVTKMNKVKEFNKKNKNFIVKIENRRYLMIGSNLKHNRF
ncbi:hypothetical protein ECANGB1_1155 [Enterospora canceri]|uniref:Uncharacterized protein n=1 Tax=Enterospora canceri TaxID=1081671 RepID=A0A1Y1S6Q6_9MICR|nr:hypothetical protein ECANGB1_1155 [Enterospora canceri]